MGIWDGTQLVRANTRNGTASTIGVRVVYLVEVHYYSDEDRIESTAVVESLLYTVYSVVGVP